LKGRRYKSPFKLELGTLALQNSLQEAIIVVDDAEVEKEIYKLVEDLQLDFSLPWSPEDVIEGESWEPYGVLTVTSEWD
jgi:hypothetical protein